MFLLTSVNDIGTRRTHKVMCLPVSVGSNIQWNGTHYVPVEQKSNQWLGSTVYSSGRDGVIVVGQMFYCNLASIVMV